MSFNGMLCEESTEKNGRRKIDHRTYFTCENSKGNGDSSSFTDVHMIDPKETRPLAWRTVPGALNLPTDSETEVEVRPGGCLGLAHGRG